MSIHFQRQLPCYAAMPIIKGHVYCTTLGVNHFSVALYLYVILGGGRRFAPGRRVYIKGGLDRGTVVFAIYILF